MEMWTRFIWIYGHMTYGYMDVRIPGSVHDSQSMWVGDGQCFNVGAKQHRFPYLLVFEANDKAMGAGHDNGVWQLYGIRSLSYRPGGLEIEC